MTRSKRKVFWLPDIYIRSCLHFPFLFLTYELAHRQGHPPSHIQGCVPRYMCLTHAGLMCMETHPYTPRTTAPQGHICFPSQDRVFVLHIKESTFGFLQKNPKIRIQVQGIYWGGGVIWKIPLWKWSSVEETVRNISNTQWWLWWTREWSSSPGKCRERLWNLRIISELSQPRGRDAGICIPNNFLSVMVDG